MSVTAPSPVPRSFSDSAVAVHDDVRRRRLPTPGRRIGAFLCDGLLVLVPSLLLTIAAAAVSLVLLEPQAAQAIADIVRGSTDPARLGGLAPLLVRIDAPGLPPSVVLAVEQSNLQEAGEVLADYKLLFRIGDEDTAAPEPGTVQIDLIRLVPSPLRWLSTFGAAAAYFTFFTAGRRSATPGKRLLGLRVLKLDGQPLTTFESFERFGGYFVSLGTFGLGLLDLWRDPNRRLAHDRVSNTVVVAGD